MVIYNNFVILELVVLELLITAYVGTIQGQGLVRSARVLVRDLFMGGNNQGYTVYISHQLCINKYTPKQLFCQGARGSSI